MAPLPKRKHSTRRKGKRLAHGTATPLPVLVACSNCGKTKMPHRICKYCNKSFIPGSFMDTRHKKRMETVQNIFAYTFLTDIATLPYPNDLTKNIIDNMAAIDKTIASLAVK